MPLTKKKRVKLIARLRCTVIIVIQGERYFVEPENETETELEGIKFGLGLLFVPKSPQPLRSYRILYKKVLPSRKVRSIKLANNDVIVGAIFTVDLISNTWDDFHCLVDQARLF